MYSLMNAYVCSHIANYRILQMAIDKMWDACKYINNMQVLTVCITCSFHTQGYHLLYDL